MAKEQKSVNDIISEIALVLEESEGDFIEHIANQVLEGKLKYIGDDMFEVEK